MTNPPTEGGYGSGAADYPPPAFEDPLHPAGAGMQPAPPADQLEQDRALLSEQNRQAPLAPIVFLFALLRAWGLNLAFIGVVASRIGDWLWLAPVAIVALLALAFLRWWRYTFQIVGDDLIVEQGIISRERKTIPLERVQSVSIEQGLINRVLGLVKAKVETAGSQGTELELEAVSRATAESLRRLTTRTANSSSAFSAQTPDGLIPPPPPGARLPSVEQGERIVVHRTLRDLVRVALSSNPLAGVGGIVAAVFLFGEELGGVFDLERRAEGALDSLTPSPLLLIGGALIAITFFVIASFLTTIIPLHELTLFRSGGGFRATSGLLSRRERVSSLERVQIIRTSQNPLQRLFDIHLVRLPSAGGDQSGGEIRLPGTRPNEVDLIRAELEHGPTPQLTRGISARAIGRWTLWGGVLPAVGLAAMLWPVVGPWGLLAVLVWPPIAWLWSQRTQQRWRWDLGPSILSVSHGALVNQQSSIAVRKVQAVQVEQTWFHRRHDLGSLTIATAAGNVTIPHLVFAEACAARDELCYRAETDPRPFM